MLEVQDSWLKKAEIKDTSRRETELCPVRLATRACSLLTSPSLIGTSFLMSDNQIWKMSFFWWGELWLDVANDRHGYFLFWW